MITNELLVDRRGEIAAAVAAHTAVPGVLPPVIRGDRLLFDGAVLDGLPVGDQSGARRVASQPSKSVATIRAPCTPAASWEPSHTIGGPMIAGSRSAARVSAGVSVGIMPVAVAPPGSRMLTVTGEPARSLAITRASASTAAPAGP